MDNLVVQIRECMVYQSPPEMGALYSEVFSMKDKIEEEQTQARLKEEAKKRQELWQRKEEERNFQLKLAYLAATTIFLLYLWLWLLFVSQLRKT
jgi:polyferredoxin